MLKRSAERRAIMFKQAAAASAASAADTVAARAQLQAQQPAG